MNILYVGPYTQQDEVGLASKSYIGAIASQKHNLTTRPVFLGAQTSETNTEILSYENSFYDQYDMVVQTVPAQHLFYSNKFAKNIGCIFLETNNITDSDYIFNINRMDEVWVPTSQEEKCLKKSGITKPIRVISQPLDVDNIRKYQTHQLGLHPIIQKSFKFYFIGEYTDRKNIKDLVTAFHLAFDVTQPVTLILKTEIPNVSSSESYKIIEKEIDEIKQQLNISKRYKKEVIITDNLSPEDTIGLHNSCDCFIMPSRGESFCRTAAEALVLGKTPIVTDNTGMIDFINNKNGFVVKSHRTPVVMNSRFAPELSNIYNANQYWYQINIYDLIENMRAAYSLHKSDKKKLEEKRKIGIESINQFSYENIGGKLCIQAS